MRFNGPCIASTHRHTYLAIISIAMGREAKVFLKIDPGGRGHREKGKSSITEHSETQQDSRAEKDPHPAIFTDNILSVKYDLSHNWAVPLMPIWYSRRDSKMPWSTVYKQQLSPAKQEPHNHNMPGECHYKLSAGLTPFDENVLQHKETHQWYYFFYQGKKELRINNFFQGFGA